MWYLYLDESGDLGFDFVNKKPSRFFTITILVVKGISDNREFIKSVKTTLRRKFNIKRVKAEELKGSKCPIEIKRYLYALIKNINFEIYSITLNKIRLYDKLRKDKERVYNYITRLVLDQIPFNTADLRVEIIVDKSKTKRNIFEFNQYIIISQIKSKFDPLVPLNIYHFDSNDNFGLQSVDLFCWGIFRKYEKKDLEWFNIFKSKVRYDSVYLP
ncbi:MAG: DUF3800 domain-containing protein [Nitrospirota bacterium]